MDAFKGGMKATKKKAFQSSVVIKRNETKHKNKPKGSIQPL